MKVFIAADHAGYGMKAKLILHLQGLGHEVVDKGAYEYNEEDDFPDFISGVAKEVSLRPNEVKGVVIGGSGQGEAMVANRYHRVRAAVYYGAATSIREDPQSILTLSRAHNDANVLSFGARFITDEEAKKVVKEWLETPFSEDERHVRRISKMDRALREPYPTGR